MVNSNHFVKSEGEYHSKISGTLAGAILGVNEYISPFEAACRLLGICTEAGVSDKPAVRTGKILEGRIIEFVGQMYDIGTVLPAEAIFGNCEIGDHEDWIPHFSDPVFTGHVDGIVSRDGVDYILECKTAKNLDKWKDEDGNVKIPAHYIKQVELYNHFVTKQDIAYLVLGAVSDETYADPDSWTPIKGVTVEVYPIEIDQEKVAQEVEQMRSWYQQYIGYNTTPQWSESNERDMEVVHYLESLSRSEMEMQTILSEYIALKKEIDEYDAVMDEKRKKLESHKLTLNEHMLAKGVHAMTDMGNTYEAHITKRATVKWDEKQMVADGINVEKYQTKTISEYVTIAKIKKKKE